MNIYLELFLTFLKIGAVSFGGGYGMISLVSEEVVKHGWLTEGQFMDFLAVCESTPGPIAVNMATFVGSSQGGVLGAALATLGVVFPAFCIILLLVAILKNLLKFAGVQAALKGIRPAVTALIIITSVTMFLSVLFGLETVEGGFDITTVECVRKCILFAVIAGIYIGYKKIFKKKISPILLILISAALGMLCYSLPI